MAGWRDAGAWLADLLDDEEANEKYDGAARNYAAAVEKLLSGPPSRVAAGGSGAGPSGGEAGSGGSPPEPPSGSGNRARLPAGAAAVVEFARAAEVEALAAGAAESRGPAALASTDDSSDSADEGGQSKYPCLACGNEVGIKHKFCNHCGNDLSRPPPLSDSSRESSPERGASKGPLRVALSPRAGASRSPSRRSGRSVSPEGPWAHWRPGGARGRSSSASRSPVPGAFLTALVALRRVGGARSCRGA